MSVCLYCLEWIRSKVDFFIVSSCEGCFHLHKRNRGRFLKLQVSNNPFKLYRPRGLEIVCKICMHVHVSLSLCIFLWRSSICFMTFLIEPMTKSKNQTLYIRGFPGGPVTKTLYSQCTGPRVNPWSGNQIPRAAMKTWHSQINKCIF